MSLTVTLHVLSYVFYVLVRPTTLLTPSRIKICRVVYHFNNPRVIYTSFNVNLTYYPVIGTFARTRYIPHLFESFLYSVSLLIQKCKLFKSIVSNQFFYDLKMTHTLKDLRDLYISTHSWPVRVLRDQIRPSAFLYLFYKESRGKTRSI